MNAIKRKTSTEFTIQLETIENLMNHVSDSIFNLINSFSSKKKKDILHFPYQSPKSKAACGDFKKINETIS